MQVESLWREAFDFIFFHSIEKTENFFVIIVLSHIFHTFSLLHKIKTSFFIGIATLFSQHFLRLRAMFQFLFCPSSPNDSEVLTLCQHRLTRWKFPLSSNPFSKIISQKITFVARKPGRVKHLQKFICFDTSFFVLSFHHQLIANCFYEYTENQCLNSKHCWYWNLLSLKRRC